ncbi:SAM-dependent methyltransferase [Streptomyces oceani]|uniref:Methyltransferase n=1 Tax=Streptomyces oceani TaxID=1075402 RepID=A0A1E7KJC0_9ACTN|nr:SAM-dependent methyltransferase [Streptomyces oceani]OEV03937.1 hypothetical protein AN216_09975 [Streptomyces oceani]
MERPAWAPQGIDLTVPSVSRIYDYYLGGSHNFEVDRAAGRAVLEAWPGLTKIVQVNRAFMRRAVRYAVGEGVDQFLDIGSGIPTFGNVHEVALAADPDSRVLYVDHDPVAVAHSRAVLQDTDQAEIVSADFRSPQDVLLSAEAERVLDLDRPVALMFVALLHFIEDKDDPWKAVAEFRDALAPGSLLIVTHAGEGEVRKPARGDDAVALYRRIGSPIQLRTRAQVLDFFEGFELLDPGLVAMPRWHPDSAPEHEDPVTFAGFAGVGRKTGPTE